jgi:hypothetical protein
MTAPLKPKARRRSSMAPAAREKLASLMRERRLKTGEFTHEARAARHEASVQLFEASRLLGIPWVGRPPKTNPGK